MDQDWQLLAHFFPYGWEDLAISTNAVKGLRKNKEAEDLLRVLMIHIACGYSLRETSARARKANLADMSDVALLKRLRKCKEWLYNLCIELFAEFGIPVKNHSGYQFRLLDATHVKEPGKTGSQWRVHYSFHVPDMRCDFFKITKTKGDDVAEDLSQFPINEGDYVIADRGYSRATGIAYIADQKAFVCVRVNTQSLLLMTPNKDEKFPLSQELQRLKITFQCDSWAVDAVTPDGRKIRGRLCVVKKTPEAIAQAHKKLKRQASKKCFKLQPQTLFLAEYVILFTTFPEDRFSTQKILEWYRVRWQIELVFKRFKQITHLGHLPKHHDESALAWLYGKLFIALMTEKIMRHSLALSPCGINMHLQPLARIPVYVSSN